MKKLLLGGIASALLLVGVAFAYHHANASSARPDCPGKMTCPMTGKEICVDRCPLDEKPATAEVPACCKKSADAKP